MSASLIATNINFDQVLGSLLVGASIVLTVHSLSRMVFLKRTASKYHLFPIINVAQFINEFCVFFLILTAFNIISFRTALWLNVVNNVAYFITKPTTLYLAYLRCSAVYPAFRKADWFHAFLIGFRAVELFAIIIINIVQNELCDGSVAKGTRCEGLAFAWTFRDAGAPIFRGYYILCELIFYYKLFKTLRGMSVGKNMELIQYRRLQISLFTVDLILLIFMSIYRIVGIFNKNLPTYVYYELFSSTLTIFTLTEFGLNIRMLFNTVSVEKSHSNTAADSNVAPSKLEMGSIHDHKNKHRPLTNSSSSPLTTYGADTSYNASEVDVSTSYQHQDYTPYPVPTPSAEQKEWLSQPTQSSGSTGPHQDYHQASRYNNNPYRDHPGTQSPQQQHRALASPLPGFIMVERPTAVPERAFAVPARSQARPRHEDHPRNF